MKNLWAELRFPLEAPRSHTLSCGQADVVNQARGGHLGAGAVAIQPPFQAPPPFLIL